MDFSELKGVGKMMNLCVAGDLVLSLKNSLTSVVWTCDTFENNFKINHELKKNI